MFAYDGGMEYSPRNREKDGRTLVLAAAIIVGLRLPVNTNRTYRVLQKADVLIC
jgi:hypothetical protein